MDYSQYFEERVRTNGDKFICLRDDLPEHLAEPLALLIQSIHGDDFYGAWPNDWIYENIRDAFERLSQCATEDEYERASCEIEPSPFSNDLWEWAYKYQCAREIIEEEYQEGAKFDTIESIITMAQIRAKERIYSRCWEFMQEHKSNA